jgi:hypothetical protein
MDSTLALIALLALLASFAQLGIKPQLAVLTFLISPFSSSALINGINVVGEIFQLLGVKAASLTPAANSSAKSSPEILRA